MPKPARLRQAGWRAQSWLGEALARLLRLAGPVRSLPVLPLLGWRQHRGEAERFEPQLPAPALGVVEVLVLLILDFLVRGLKRVAHLARGVLCALPDELPVGVVLGLGEHDAFAGD